MSQHDLGGFSLAGHGAVNQNLMVCSTLSPDASLLGVADGLGGRAAGDIASGIAIKKLVTMVEKSTDGWDAKEIFEAICNDLADAEASSANYAGLSTTLTFCTISGLTLRYGHVGDTRLYHLRSAGIRTVTIDQTEVVALIEQGIMRQEDAKRYHRRGVLLSALSGSRNFTPTCGSLNLLPGDRIVITSDGVHTILAEGL